MQNYCGHPGKQRELLGSFLVFSVVQSNRTKTKIKGLHKSTGEMGLLGWDSGTSMVLSFLVSSICLCPNYLDCSYLPHLCLVVVPLPGGLNLGSHCLLC